jgi:hypothetical protein
LVCHSVTLPSSTLLFGAEGRWIGVVQTDRTVQLGSVKLGRDFGQSVEMLAGGDVHG